MIDNSVCPVHSTNFTGWSLSFIISQPKAVKYHYRGAGLFCVGLSRLYTDFSSKIKTIGFFYTSQV